MHHYVNYFKNTNKLVSNFSCYLFNIFYNNFTILFLESLLIDQMINCQSYCNNFNYFFEIIHFCSVLNYLYFFLLFLRYSFYIFKIWIKKLNW